MPKLVAVRMSFPPWALSDMVPLASPYRAATELFPKLVAVRTSSPPWARSYMLIGIAREERAEVVAGIGGREGVIPAVGTVGHVNGVADERRGRRARRKR